MLQIQAVNDAPTPREKISSDVPLVPFKREHNTGIRVGDFAGNCSLHSILYPN